MTNTIQLASGTIVLAPVCSGCTSSVDDDACCSGAEVEYVGGWRSWSAEIARSRAAEFAKRVDGFAARAAAARQVNAYAQQVAS